MIEISADREGHSLRFLVWQGLKKCSTMTLFQFLEDGDVIVRSTAARELQLRGGQNVFDRTGQLLQSKSKTTRELAAFVLGQLGTPKRPYKKESTKLLMKLLRSETNAVVRATAISSLGDLKAIEALPLIIKYAKDPSPSVRGSVAFAIGMTYSEKSKEIPLPLLKVLRKLRNDKARVVREDAALGLDLLHGSSRTSPTTLRSKC